ncbi:MAG: response regulator [Deltaproteobacteria bacterium]|nr:response regulator [Deltaproteobacteria bacterium]
MTAPRLLVVDDSLTIRRALEFILKPRGFVLEFAADGREALDRAASFRPDLVLLDYVLPDMRGPDVCSALAALPVTARTPVILVSAKGASIRQAYQDAQNVVSYVTKPFKPQIVVSVVDNALSRSLPESESAPSAEPEPLPATPTAYPTLRPATVEETFSTLLAQLEDAVSTETRKTAPAVAPIPLERLGASLRGARELLREIEEHLSGEAVAPYRLRADGSFANIAATLLDTHRMLCQATLALAAGGAPGPRLPVPPRIVVAVPPDHESKAALGAIVEAQPAGETLLVDRDFACLPHVVHLLQPDLLIGVPGADEALDAALERSAPLGAEQTRRFALVAPEASLEERFGAYQPLSDPDQLARIAGETSAAVRPGVPTSVDADFEVLSL